MNLHHSLSNQALHLKLVSLATEERRITLEVLIHLREVERRRLFAERGHSSLFDYAVRELTYSESAAQRRISAMRVLKDLPELEEKVRSGELKVTQLARVQTFLRSEKKEGKTYSHDEKRTLILGAVGKSSRETEKLLAEKSPTFAFQEKMRVLTPSLTQLTFTADEQLIENLAKIRDVFAHQLPCPSGTADLVAFMAERLLEAHRKRTETSISSAKKNKQRLGADPRVQKQDPEMTVPESLPAQGQKALPAPQVRSRYIPASVRRAVWDRDRGRCTYVSSTTKRRCESRHRIQIDHVTPYIFGGLSNDVTGLRLLCFTHNQSEARRLIEKQGF